LCAPPPFLSSLLSSSLSPSTPTFVLPAVETLKSSCNGLRFRGNYVRCCCLHCATPRLIGSRRTMKLSEKLAAANIPRYRSSCLSICPPSPRTRPNKPTERALTQVLVYDLIQVFEGMNVMNNTRCVVKILKPVSIFSLSLFFSCLTLTTCAALPCAGEKEEN